MDMNSTVLCSVFYREGVFMSVPQRFLGKLKIKNKLFLSLVPIILLTYIIIMLILYYVSFVETRRLVEEQVLINISQKARLSDNYLKKIFVETEIFMFDTEVQEKIKTKKSALSTEEQSKLNTEVLNNMLKTIISYDDSVQGICLKNQFGDIYLWKMDSRSLYNSFTYRIDSLESKADSFEGKPYLSYERLEQNMMTVTRTIMEPLTRKKIGVLMIDFSMDFLNDVSLEYLGETQADILIFSPDNGLIINTGNVEDAVIQRITEGHSSFRVGGSHYSVVRKASSNGDWEIVGLVNETVLYHKINGATIQQIVFMGISLLLILSVIYYISWTISGQFKRFMAKIQNMPNTDGKSVDIHVDTKDEFRDLSEVYNQMVARIRSLIDTIYAKEVHLKNAEIKALHAQINPHFLYNTLDCINSLIERGEKEKSQKAVGCLTDIMRMSVKEVDSIQIREDLSYLQKYLFIQQCRFGSRILFLIEVPEPLQHYMIPKLVLQPLVENAINHGLRDSLQGGMLGIFGEEEEDAVLLYVKDNGSGIRQEIIDQVENVDYQRSNIYYSDTGGIGVMNIQSRIQLMYGPEYGIRIRNLYQNGTSVQIRIPKILPGEAYENFNR